MPTTTRLAIPTPTSASPADVPADLLAMATAIDANAMSIGTADTVTGVKTFNVAPRHAVQALTATGAISGTGGKLVTFAGAASQVLTLPAAVVGMEFEVVNIDASDTVSVARAGTDTIDGASTSIVVQPGETVNFTVLATGAWISDRHEAHSVTTGARLDKLSPLHGVTGLAATVTIPAGHGRLYTFSGAASQVITLPAAVLGDSLEILNIDTADTVNVIRAGTDVIRPETQPGGAGDTATCSCVPGQRLRFVCDQAGVWRVEQLNTPLVAALPANPWDGMRVDYQTSDMATTHRAVWPLRYRAAATTYKWEAVGATPLRKEVDTGEAFNGAYGNLATAENITIPNAGVYALHYGAQIDYTVGTAGNQGLYAPSGAGVTAADADAVRIIFYVNMRQSVSRVREKTLTVGTLRMNAKTTSAAVGFYDRFLYVTPIAIS